MRILPSKFAHHLIYPWISRLNITKRNRRRLSKKWYPHTSVNTETYSRTKVLTSSRRAVLGTTLLSFCQVQRQSSHVRSTLLHAANRNNSTPSSMNISVWVVSVLRNPPWPLLSSLSRRKTENYVRSKTTVN